MESSELQVEAGEFSFLRGQLCWEVIAGSGAGSNIRLLIGDRIKRLRPIPNPTLSPLAREYDSAFDVFVQCAWRLSTSGRIVCSSLSYNLNEGPMVAGLRSLIGSTIMEIDLNVGTLDLLISFSNGLRFSIFNDVPTDGDDDEAYSIRGNRLIHCIRHFQIYRSLSRN